MAFSLDTPLEELPHVTKRFVAHLARLGLRTVRDLLFHFPARYEDFSAMKPIAELDAGERATVHGTVEDVNTRRSWRRRFTIVEASVADESGALRAVWFNQPYIAQQLKRGHAYNFSGKISVNEEGELYLSNPSFELMPRMNADGAQIDADRNNPRESALYPRSSAPVHTGRLVPVYPETRGLTSKGLRFLVFPLLKNLGSLSECIPSEVLRKENLPELHDALQTIHFPRTHEDAARAKRRFSFEDLFLLQLSNLRERMALEKETALAIPVSVERLKKLTAALPFSLTASQKKSLWEICQDLSEPHPMNRLLQGDVGSGKTVVAALAAFLAAEAGLQTAIMAPTEILARQHYETFKKLSNARKSDFLGKSDFPNIGLLTAHESFIALSFPRTRESRVQNNNSEEKTAKKSLKEKIARGEVTIIIGTHALLSENIAWHNLGLVVIDEQHRFGVKQRAALVRPPRMNADGTQIDADKNNENDSLLFRDLTYKIRGIIFKVCNAIGQGLKESIYQSALAEEFAKERIRFEREKIIDVRYNEKKIGVFRPDFVIEDKIILEIKAVPFVGKIEERKIWSCLKGTHYKVALLANFGGVKLQLKRIVYDTARNPRESASHPRPSASLPHFLSMSATPIPRTLTLTVFGDLDLSTITELPPGRKPVKTYVVPPEKRAKGYEFIRKQVKEGRQVFVICPRIQAQTNADATQTNADNQHRSVSSRRASAWSQRQSAVLTEVKTVEEEYEKLSTKIFPDLRVAMLHGKLKAKEKERIMREFREGACDILVSTTVVEVGVDIPNATIMLIEGADRFGLAQLYQLRGRVGRGAHESYCFLFTSDSPAGAVPAEASAKAGRLHAITKAKNGFELAEFDLKQRGPGEFMGTMQTGFPDSAMEALMDPPLISASREAAKDVLRMDPELAKHPALAARLAEFEHTLHLE
jgi:ATP-dependent DNA helicase RecG